MKVCLCIEYVTITIIIQWCITFIKINMLTYSSCGFLVSEVSTGPNSASASRSKEWRKKKLGSPDADEYDLLLSFLQT